MGILTYIILWLQNLRSNQLRSCVVGLTSFLILCIPIVGHTETSSGEYSLKAAFIFNFAKYIEWPLSAFKGKEEICIGTLGRSQLDKELAALSGRNVLGRTILIRQFNSPEEATQCHILFISRPELAKLGYILDTLKDLPVLTIADSDEFCKSEGMLSLMSERGKIVFDVNIQETQRARLKLNPQLMRLAKKIYGR